MALVAAFFGRRSVCGGQSASPGQDAPSDAEQDLASFGQKLAEERVLSGEPQGHGGQVCRKQSGLAKGSLCRCSLDDPHPQRHVSLGGLGQKRRRAVEGRGGKGLLPFARGHHGRSLTS